MPQRPEAIASRVRLALANEAYFALGDGVATADRIDLALRLGAAHPQGPLEWAIAQGLDAVHAELQGAGGRGGRAIRAGARPGGGRRDPLTRTAS